MTVPGTEPTPTPTDADAAGDPSAHGGPFASDDPSQYGSLFGHGSPFGHGDQPGPASYGPGSPPPTFDSPDYDYGYRATPGWTPAIDGPKAWPVAVFTVLFGIFGALSAARRSTDARAQGLPGGRYWGVFAGALVGSFAIWTFVLGVGIAVTVPLYLETTSTVMTTNELEQELASSDSVGGSVTGATCLEEAVDPLGAGTYSCRLRLDDGADLPYRITVSDDGSWAASSTG